MTGRENTENNYGVQPLDAGCLKFKLTNADIVKHSTEQLTFKQVQKARTGRRVTPNIQAKIVRAVNSCVAQKQLRAEDLFNY